MRNFSSLGILENLEVPTQIHTLTPMSTLIEYFLQKLKLEPCESIRYLLRNAKRFYMIWCFAFVVNEFVLQCVWTWRHQILKSKAKDPRKVLSSSGKRGSKFMPVFNFQAQ